jgi:two-component system, sensor histidine kinase
MTPTRASSPPNENRRHRRVLVVEDNDDGRETLRLLLELCGYEVAVAADGVAGVQKAHEFRPDAALIDLGLPGMDGLQVARTLRAVFGEAVLLVAVTGLAQPEDRRRTWEAGFDAHLRKPADLDELQRLLRGTA